MSLLPVSAIPVEGGYNINNSLRFRKNATGYLNRTFATPTSSTTWTVSLWFKRSEISSAHSHLFTTSLTDNFIRFQTSTDILQYAWANGSTVQSTAVFRDPSAWYHLVVAVDTTQATSSNRIRMYINGSEIAYGSSTYPALNATTLFNTARAHYLSFTSNQFDGYVAEVNWIDGQQLTPTSFGETDTTTGVWKPKAYTGLYGANGFYLKFSDATIVTPTLINTTTAVQNTSATTISVNVPAGTTNGDLMILVATTGVSTQTAPWTTPSGWTLWGNSGGRTVFYKTASSEPASYTLTHSVSSTLSACILTYRNAAIDVFGTYSANASPSDAPSITTTANNAVVLDYVAGRTNASTTYTTPTNFTSLVADSDATQPSYAVFSRVQATAGATGTASSTPSSGTAVSVQFSIKPTSNTNLGLDYSGNGNNWTTNNISVTSGVAYDAMTDSPTLTSATVANYCTLNPVWLLSGSAPTITNGNLQVTSVSTGDSTIGGTIGMTGSGKYYAEFTAGTSSIYGDVGIINITHPASTAIGDTATSYNYRSNGNKNNNSTQTAYGASYTNNDVIGVAFDLDNGTIEFYKNNTSQGTAFTGISASNTYVFACGDEYSAGNFTWTANFGQRPFAYTPPTGYKALNTYNLPDSTIVKGNVYMDATTYTGTGASRSVTNAAGFKPDLVWTKSRGTASVHKLTDSVRGVTKGLKTDTSAETTDTNGLTAFNSNGFTLGSDSDYNGSTRTYVAWQWQGNQGTNVTNTNGSITSTVSANATAGFSIVTYTGTAANATVGHGLGVAPKMVITKCRSSGVAADIWSVYHTSTGAGNYLRLNGNQASTAGTTWWNNTAPTSSVFSIGTENSVNKSGQTYIAYCFAEIGGFSKFGSYTGNGSTNGTFVYLGFRPKYVVVKRTDSTDDWRAYDSVRDGGYNGGLAVLYPDLSAVEDTGASQVDILSNGFKLRNATWANNSGGTFIYMAFAENPFKNSLAR